MINLKLQFKIKKLLKILLIFILVSSWLLAGWPSIWLNPRFPPKIQEALAYDIDVTYDFDPEAGADAGWTWVGPDGTGLAPLNTDGYWCWESDDTTSSGVGPTSGQGGDPEGYVYTETSSPVEVNDEFTMTLTTAIDASTYSFTVDFYYSQDFDGDAGELYFEVWDGDSWEQEFFNNSPCNDPAWVNVVKDLSSYTNSDLKVRFRTVVKGTAWHNDAGIDTVRIYGDMANQVTIADSTLSQPTNVTEGDTAVVMGAFTFISDTSTATVTQIIINEEGTVDANTNLSNVKLYYQEEATCTFAGSSQLGTTQSFDGSDEATFGSLSLSVGTTTQQCVFVVLDVGSAAGAGNTIEIQIDEAGDVTITDGSPTGSFPVQISGPTTIRADSGTVLSTETDFNWTGETDWGEVIWSTNEPSGADVKLYVYYDPEVTEAEDCDTIVPNGALSGNESGFDVSASPKDISGLNTTTYNRICLKAELTVGTSASPTLDDWGITWEPPAVNQAPTVDSVSIDPSPTITLNTDSTKTVTITATITDNDGCEDVFTNGSITGVFFDDAAEDDTCTQDDNDCYTSLTLTEVDDTCTGAGDYTADASADVNVWFIANPSSSWTAKVTATDEASESGSNTETAEINTLNAFKLDVGSIGYGTVDPNNVSTQQAILITTTGNAAIDVQLSGDNMVWSGNTILVGQQKYSDTDGFNWETEGDSLTGTPACHELSTGKPTEHPSVETENVYWKLKVPTGKPGGGPYSGTNYFDVVSDASCP